MSRQTWMQQKILNPWAAVIAAAIAPVAVCALIAPLRAHVPNTNAALVLVLVVVAAAATGHRAAGLVAAVMSGLAFDFFLTEPYERFAISKSADLQTAGLLILVGIGVTELAVWGRRQQAAASRDAGFLAGVVAASDAAARGVGSPSELIAAVCDQLARVLGVEHCSFDYGTGVGFPRLQRDGGVVWRGERFDALVGTPPFDKDVELFVESGGSFRGRFLFMAPDGLRLTQKQLTVATSLANEVGASLAEFQSRRS